MLSNKDQKKVHFLIQVAFIAVFVLVIFLAFQYVIGIIAPFLIAFIAASIIDPLVRFLTKKAHFPRGIASTVSIILLLAVLVFLSIFLSRTLWAECKSLFEEIPIYLKSLTDRLEVMMQKNEGVFAFIPDTTVDSIIDYISDYDYTSLVTGSLGSHLIGYAGNVVIYIPNALIFLIVTIVSSIFMSISLPTVKSFILAQFKPKTQNLIIDIKHNLFATVGKYLLSYSLLMFMTFVELFIFFLIFGFDSPLVLALVIAIVDILPILGVGTVLIPWSVISLITGEPITALILICMYIVITVIRQIMEPKIIGDHVGMMPLLTLFCIWVGLKLFGFIGMFMFPITVVVLKNLQDSGKIKLWKTPIKDESDEGEISNGNS